MNQSDTDGAVGIPLVVMGCIAVIYYACSSATRKVLISIWWWLCPVVFGFFSFVYFGDIWGAVKTALVSIFWVGIPGGLMLGYLGGQEKTTGPLTSDKQPAYDSHSTSDDVNVQEDSKSRLGKAIQKRIVNCPACRQKCRIPVGKKLEVCCPACNLKWIERF